MSNTRVWFTGPGDDDMIEIHIHPNEVIIWQNLRGDITSVTADAETALELAAFIQTHLDRRN